MVLRTLRGGKDLAAVADMLFAPKGKEPYYHGGSAIRNLDELANRLDNFTTAEANWVASWIEYLGDGETAEKIRKSTANFKDIVRQRHRELKKFRR